LKLLVDMNLSPMWVEELGKVGIEAAHWSTIGDPRAPDQAIFEWARAHHAASARVRILPIRPGS